MLHTYKRFCLGLSALLALTMGACEFKQAPQAVSPDILSNNTISGSPSMVSTVSARPSEWDREEQVNPKAAEKSRKTSKQKLPSFRMSIQAAKAENSHTVGWLWVPDTSINGGILQNPKEDNPYPVKNNYYLNRSWDGSISKNGTFCADYRATFGAGETGLQRLTALYGHSWDDDPNGTLFSPLKNFRDPTFARTHPYIFFSTEYDDMVWEVFAVFDTTVYLPYVRPGLPDDKYFQTMDMVYDLSYYNYDVAVSDEDRILVLSTCTYTIDGNPHLPEENDYRFVVMAKLVPSGQLLKKEAEFAINTARALPDETRKLRHL